MGADVISFLLERLNLLHLVELKIKIHFSSRKCWKNGPPGL